MGKFLLKLGDRVNRVLTYVPVAQVVLLVLLAAWVRLVILGRWPVTYRDEDVGVIGALLSAVSIWLWVGVLFGLPLWLITLVCVGILRGRRPVIYRVLTFVAAVCLFLGLHSWNPEGFIDWWMD